MAQQSRGRLPFGYPSAIGLAVVAVAFAFFLRGLPQRPVHPDEVLWISQAHYLEDLLDPSGPNWNPKKFAMREAPKLGSVWMGVALVAQGRDLETNPNYDWDMDEAQNRAAGNWPDPDDLVATRRASALLMAISAGMVFLIATLFSNAAGGVAAALVFMTHPVIHAAGQRAMVDALWVFFALLASLLAWWFARAPGWGRAVALGAALGLGGAAKLTPVLFLGPLLLLGLLAPKRPLHVGGRTWVAAPRLRLASLAMVPAALVGFAAFDPWLWRDPVDRSVLLFQVRGRMMEWQSTHHPDIEINGARDSIRLAWVVLGQRETLAQALLVAGLAGTVLMVRRALVEGPWSAPAYLQVVLVGQAVVVLVAIRVAWFRYYVTVETLLAVGAGVLFGALIGEILRRWQERPGDPSPASLAPTRPDQA